MLGFVLYLGCGVILEGKFNNYVFIDWVNSLCVLRRLGFVFWEFNELIYLVG